jgi:ABC-type lipopolysaccharide export system ATPase subunit
MLPRDLRVRQLLRAVPSQDELVEDQLIARIRNQYVDELSGGERRYLEIRLVLALDRAYALLDEPFTGVEPKLIDRISDLIVATARKGRGVLVTDHYHHYTVPIADDAYLMLDKQCRRLDGGDIKHQLVRMGYIHGG